MGGDYLFKQCSSQLAPAFEYHIKERPYLMIFEKVNQDMKLFNLLCKFSDKPIIEIPNHIDSFEDFDSWLQCV